jgi:hypothetical protein
MNPILKEIINLAMADVFIVDKNKRNDALDMIYTKLIVRPMQNAWKLYRDKNYKRCLCCYDHSD